MPEGTPPVTAATAAGGRAEAGTPSGGTVPETPEQKREDADLAAYNDYLAQLAEQDRASGRCGSGGRARTSNIRLQRPTFCRLNYPGVGKRPRARG